MPSVSGRRRSPDGARWITYWATYDKAGDGSVSFVTALGDEQGAINTPKEVYCISFDSAVMTSEEAARQAICNLIDRTPLPAGEPPDQQWLNMRASGRLRLL